MIFKKTTYLVHHDLEMLVPDHLFDQEGAPAARLAHSDIGTTVIRRGIVELCLYLLYPSQNDFKSSLKLGGTINDGRDKLNAIFSQLKKIHWSISILKQIIK